MSLLSTTYMTAITSTVLDVMKGKNWDDVVFYSEVFLTLPEKHQREWVAKMKARYEATLPTGSELPNLYEVGRAFLAYQHYQNLYDQAHPTLSDAEVKSIHSEEEMEVYTVALMEEDKKNGTYQSGDSHFLGTKRRKVKRSETAPAHTQPTPQ